MRWRGPGLVGACAAGGADAVWQQPLPARLQMCCLGGLAPAHPWHPMLRAAMAMMDVARSPLAFF